MLAAGLCKNVWSPFYPCAGLSCQVYASRAWNQAAVSTLASGGAAQAAGGKQEWHWLGAAAASTGMMGARPDSAVASGFISPDVTAEEMDAADEDEDPSDRSDRTNAIHGRPVPLTASNNLKQHGHSGLGADSTGVNGTQPSRAGKKAALAAEIHALQQQLNAM